MRAAEVLSPCPRCKVEGALLEIVDLSGAAGVTLSGRCRLCAYAIDAGDVVHLGDPFVDPADVVDALGRWARDDGDGDVHAFVDANFLGLKPGEVATLVIGGEPVATSFDVVARLFPGMGGGRGADLGNERPRVGEGVALPKYVAPPEPPPRPADAADITRALVSVTLADGVVRTGERAAVARLRAELGGPDVPEAQWRVWRPDELGPVPDPKALFEAMRRVALSDREADGSEARVLREYARAWGLPLERARLPRPGTLAAIGRAIAGIVGL